MEFSFNKEQDDIRKAANDFARKELAENEIEKTDQVAMETVRLMGTLGFLGLKVSEKYGGEQATWLEVGIVVEEIAKGNISMAYLLMMSYQAGRILEAYASQEIKAEWLKDICRGNKLACISASEPSCGSDLGAVGAIAIRHGNHYLLNGKKAPVSFGAQAGFTILFANTGRETGLSGLTAFLVPLDLPGISITPIKTMGLLPTAPVQLAFDDVRVPLQYRIGHEGEGGHIHANFGFASNSHRILSGLIPLSTAQSALDMALSYAKKREAFGRPVAQFQAISGKIAEGFAKIEMGKSLCHKGLWLIDQGLPGTKEAAMCSWLAPKFAYQIIEDAILIHGHAGYSDDHPFQQMLRDVIAFELIGGTEEMMKLIIARNVIGKPAIPPDVWNQMI